MIVMVRIWEVLANRRRWASLVALVLAATMALTQGVVRGEPLGEFPRGAVEVGLVQWQRDYAGALAAGERTNKPVFLLFQEVPGCIGCQNFGKEVLSHPLLVEAIEDEFIPLLVLNNRFGGKDEEIRKRYGEPSWNFQVVRFLDSKGDDIIPRRDRIWTIDALAERMVSTLETSGREVPGYLRSLVVEYAGDHLELAVFSMYCFWTGEYVFGSIDGVVATEAGWYQGREVTRVVYNTTLLSRQRLVALAAEKECADTVYLEEGERLELHGLKGGYWQESGYRPASAEDQKKQLRQWPAIDGLPGLTPLQRTKLNAFLPRDPSRALAVLSPRQRAAIDE